ncbi:MAG: DUF4258 domain-containing protein [Nitrospinales bacterium]
MDSKILDFIKSCVEERKIKWTYHVNMRLGGRFIPRTAILDSVATFEIIEEYSRDKYLPSYLIRSKYLNEVIHILAAPDVETGNVIIITAYKPDPRKWDKEFKVRRKP